MLNVFLVLALATAVLLAIVSGARPAHALPPDFTVNTTTDENLTLSTNTLCVSPSGCSLRAALEAADNRGAVATTISVPFLSGTYNLDPTLGALQVGAVAGETVTVTGNIDPTITMAGCTETLTLSCMIFFVDPSGNGGVTVTLSSITISGGHTALGGGGILGGSLTATPDVLTVSNCTITGNSATGGGNGGGISFAHGSLTVSTAVSTPTTRPAAVTVAASTSPTARVGTPSASPTPPSALTPATPPSTAAAAPSTCSEWAPTTRSRTASSRTTPLSTRRRRAAGARS